MVIHLSKWKASAPVGDMGTGLKALKMLLELPQIKKVGVTLLGTPFVSLTHHADINHRRCNKSVARLSDLHERLCGAERNGSERRSHRV